MGGAAPVDSGKGRKKALDAELNLVPFIDLLSCLISFLLITAVWSQVSTLRAASTGGLGGEPKPDELPLRLTVTERGYQLEVGSAAPIVIATKSTEAGPVFDNEALAKELQRLKADRPEQKAITVAVEDGIRFEQLAEALDRAAAAELTEPTVTPLQ